MTDQVFRIGQEVGSMAIDRINGAGINRPQKLDESRGSAGRTDSASESGGDRVELSSDARQVATLEERARELPDIRRETVDAIKRDLAAGTHEVDPRHLARLILEFEDAIPA